MATDINRMFGNNQTELGRALSSSVAENFKYSLDSNLAMAVETMEDQILAKGLDSSYKCQENHTQVASKLVNKTELPLTDATVNAALTQFTESTGIPLVIVVEDSQEVFGKQIATESIITLVIAAGLIALAVFLVVKGVKQYKASKDNQEGQNRPNGDSNYDQFDDF